MKGMHCRLATLAIYFMTGLVAIYPQSLSDVVKQEKKRNADAKTQGKVYTNQDLDRSQATGSVTTANTPSGEPQLTGKESEEADVWIKEKEIVMNSSAWLGGAAGYEKALREHRGARKPLLLYFYTDWCGYCRQFNRDILTSSEFKQYMKEVLSVRINPETGPSERALAKQYGVTGYPSFFVLPAGSDQASKLSGYRRQAGQWVAMSPSAFVQSCKEISGR